MTDLDVDVDVFLVQLREGGDLGDDDVAVLQHHLMEVVSDESDHHNAQVIFEAVEKDEDFTDGILEIEIVGDHHPDLLHEVLDWLADEKH